ncbi:MAG TPA: helix-turn-helix domain-containing protein [Candidatus Melainabacteria bacterium]|nr:helix-turn-helix domain-containing protein [Candidatus Melainabacteria bacterium]
MIQNERQYRISKAAAERFKVALGTFDESRSDVHPLLLKAEKDALASQLESLVEEITEYEYLKAGHPNVLTLDSLEQLPAGLIKARIALGLTQKELAEKLGLKEQQIQKYESEHYRSTSLERLIEIANALGVTVREQIYIGKGPSILKTLLSRLGKVGLDWDLVEERLLDPRLTSELTEQDGEHHLLNHLVTLLHRVFGWEQEELVSTSDLPVPRLAAASARYKLPSRRDSEQVAIYSSYVYYLAKCIAAALQTSGITSGDLRTSIESQLKGKKFSLEDALNVMWDCGIGILPLKDHGTFHGACWRIDGKNVIVVKQITDSESRWLFDLLHEFFHVSENDSATQLEVLELPPDAEDRRLSQEEVNANMFATRLLLGESAEDILDECWNSTQGHIPLLKSTVEQFAARHDIDVGTLANCMAYRLAAQGVNWWGAAKNLETSQRDPWAITRDVFLKRFDLSSLTEVDLRLVTQALE